MSITLDGTTGITAPAATIAGTVSGSPVQGGLVSGTAVASTSGTSIDFTDIPSWVKRITVMFSGVSTNGASSQLIQIGDSGGIEITGYVSTGAYFNVTGTFANTQATTGFLVNSAQAVDALSGFCVLSLLDAATNTWTLSGNFAGSSSAVALLISSGGKSLSATLDRVRITNVNGTDTFDAGTINILYEG